MNSEDGTVSPSLPHAVHSPSFNDEHKTWSRPPCFPRGIHYPRSHYRAETRNHRTVAPSKEVDPNPGFWGFDCAAPSLTLSLRPSLQRLFSMFPNGWPGRGLLLLRLGAVAQAIRRKKSTSSWPRTSIPITSAASPPRPESGWFQIG